jgi:hypothetical protein
MRAHHLAILRSVAVAASIAGSSAPAAAQVWTPQGDVYQMRGDAYQNGYRRGFQNGAADARSRRSFEYRRDGEYRDADWGYDRRHGSRDAYRRVFRDGFEAGYREGYNGRHPGRRDDRYGSWGYGDGYRTGGASQVAFNFGYNDGHERGAKAARERKRYDPQREGWYRDGDRHYDSDYGPREFYKPAYREGFLRGYEEGYQGRGDYRR